MVSAQDMDSGRHSERIVGKVGYGLSLDCRGARREAVSDSERRPRRNFFQFTLPTGVERIATVE